MYYLGLRIFLDDSINPVEVHLDSLYEKASDIYVSCIMQHRLELVMTPLRVL